MTQQLQNWPPYLFAGYYILPPLRENHYSVLETNVVLKNFCLLDVDYHSFMYKGCYCALDRNVPSASACGSPVRSDCIVTLCFASPYKACTWTNLLFSFSFVAPE
jgi:hypothetical protein